MNKAFLEISSWKSFFSCASHYYGSLCYDNGDEEQTYIELKKKITKKNISEFKRKDPYDVYAIGQYTTRFGNVSEVRKKGIQTILKVYPEVEILFEGRSSCASVQKVLWCRDVALKNTINMLYEEADKLNYYSGSDDTRMEEIDKEFENLVS